MGTGCFFLFLRENNSKSINETLFARVVINNRHQQRTRVYHRGLFEYWTKRVRSAAIRSRWYTVHGRRPCAALRPYFTVHDPFLLAYGSIDVFRQKRAPIRRTLYERRPRELFCSAAVKRLSCAFAYVPSGLRSMQREYNT